VGSALQAFILGVIEGATEFLPISSTGHMILAFPLLGVNPEEPPWHAFLYFIQIGAILAIIACFARRLGRAISHVPPGGLKDHLLTKLFVASLPAAAIGLPLNDWVEKHLETPPVVATALVLGAIAMELIERRFRKTGGPAASLTQTAASSRLPDEGPAVTLRQALLIGLAQCISIIPGTSRAMVTILGGLVAGLSPAAATEFSFYLAIPTLLGAGLLKIVSHRSELHADEVSLLVIGFISAFVSAMLVVQPFLHYVKTRPLRPFAIYRVVLGLAVLSWWWAHR